MSKYNSSDNLICKLYSNACCYTRGIVAKRVFVCVCLFIEQHYCNMVQSRLCIVNHFYLTCFSLTFFFLFLIVVPVFDEIKVQIQVNYSETIYRPNIVSCSYKPFRYRVSQYYHVYIIVCGFNFFFNYLFCKMQLVSGQ